VWQGSTVGVAYGGTGVTASSGANSVVLRDANQNIVFNNYVAGFTATTASAGTTVLTVASARNQVLVGSTTHTFQMPNATTLQLGQSFLFVNNSSGVLTITNNASAVIETIPSGGVTTIGATNISTSAGTFGIYAFLPGSYDFNTTTATFNGAAISSAVWNGTTIATGYGGTGLTTYTSGGAVYANSSSTLTSGTLPVTAGGTGNTSGQAASTAYSATFNSGGSGDASGSTFNGSGALTVSYNTIGAPSVSGTNATGTWGISISGNAATATLAATATSAPSYLPLAGGTLTGKVVFPSTTAIQPQMPNGFLGLNTGDGNFDIWGISGEYYPSNPTAANAWGIRWDGDSNQIRFIGGGSVRVSFDLDDGTTQINGNTVLNAGNYNSYAPTLTGTGATGTWAINISGNAATATNGLTTVNYNSYAPTLTGTGASGTWGISITGNAATLGGYAPNQTGGANTIVQRDSNGYIQNSYFYTSGGGSERNSSGMGYFAGFNSSDYYIRSYTNAAAATIIQSAASGTWNINITGSAGSSGSSSSVSASTSTGIQTSYSSTINTTTPGLANYGFAFSGVAGADYAQGITWGWNSTNAQAGIYVQSSGSYGTKMYFGTTDSFATGSKTSMSIDHNGTIQVPRSYLQSDSSLRAPIFYDSNNTGYYVDPASTSNLNAVSLNGVMSWADGTYALGSPSYGFRFNDTASTINAFIISNAGVTTSYASSRAPIFYDSNNTGFYVDPASSSILNSLNLTSAALSLSGTIVVSKGATWTEFKDPSGATKFWLGNDASIYMNASNYYLRSNDSGSTWVDINASLLQHSSSLRAPIFYDSNNTGYYLDPASTSNLNQVNFQSFLRRNQSAAGYLEGYYGTSTDGNSSCCIYTIGGNYQPGSNSLGNMYGVGFTVGNGTTNPGLGQTGWGLYVAAGGTSRIFLDSDNGVGIASASWRAPVFYDRDNTGYYGDFAGTSRMANINYDNLYFAGDTTYGLIGRNGYLDTVNGRGSDPLELNYYDGGVVKIGSGANGSKALYASQLYATIFYDSDDTGYYVNPAGVSQFSQVYANNYFRAQGGTGLYNQDYAYYFDKNPDTYGNWRCGVNPQNSYVGISYAYSSSRVTTMFDSGGNGGLYNYSYWIYYWLASNACLGVRTSSTSSSYAMYVDGGIYSTGNVVAYSDVRKKREIVTVDNALETVNKLRGVFYKRIETNDEKVDPNKRQIGVIAQEVNEVLPEAVTYAKDVDEYGVQYGNMAGLFIEAIKELTAKIDALEQRIAA
jgi:hypothetical protein